MAHHPKPRGISLLPLAVLGLALITCSLAHATTITVVNLDGSGEGFNDPTAVDPVGGNPGTTLGAQRLNAFQHAANIWAGLITSPIEIRVGARFDPLTCNATSAVLGSAGPTQAFRDFAGAPVANTWYPVALANALRGIDLAISADDISATFNSTIGTSCALPVDWYYGLDGNPGSDIDFVSVVVHELGHGLGFLTFVNLTTGAKLAGLDDAYMRHLERHGATPSDYPTMTDAQRVAASTDTGNLHWVGPNVEAASGVLTAGRVGDHVEMFAPSPAQTGSSVSHWHTALTPNQVMEPSYTGPLHAPDLELPLFRDLGWPGQTLSVSLGANPSGGAAPLSTVLTASVSGTAAGTVNYTFWWNCSDAGTSVSTVTATCGDPTSASVGAKFDGVTNTTQSITHVYSSAGVFPAKVIAERGTASPAEMRATITVTAPPPPITSPVPGSTLTSNTVTFTGGHTSADLQHWLYMGTSLGANNLFSQDLGTGHSATVSGLPNSGTIYVRYWTRFSSGWQSTGQQYTMNVGTFNYTLANSGGITVTQGTSGSNTITATLTAGSTQSVSFSASGLPSGATASFTPTACNPTCFTQLTISTASSTPTGTFSITVTGSPLGKTTTFNLVVNPPTAPPPITSPVPGSTLTSNTVTFTGGHTSADLQHWLYMGTSLGANNLFSQDLGTGHSATVSGLPNSGTVYVRYWTRFSSGWQSTGQQYTMNVAAPIFQDDIENGSGTWFAQAPWALTTATAHSATHSWTDSPGGNYSNNANVSLWSPFLNFSGFTSVTLTFWHRYDLESGFDFGNVWVTTNNGSTFTQVASFTGTNTTWTQSSPINLNAFAGQPSVRILFQLLSDSSVTRDGWYIDDAVVTGTH